MAETELGTVHSFNDWASLRVEDRALTMGAVIIRAQLMPKELTKDDFFILGLAWNDKEALAFLDQDAINRNLDFDFSDASTPDAAMNALMRWSEGGRYNGEVGKTLTTAWSVHNNTATWADAILAVPFLVFAGAAAVASAGPVAAAAGWAASGVSTSAVGLAVSGATGAMATTRAGQAFNYLVHNQGISNVLSKFQKGGVTLARWLAGLSIFGAEASWMADAIIVGSSDAAAIEEWNRVKNRQVKIADLEKAGYTVEIGGQVQAADENLQFAVDPNADDVVIKGPDGVVVSPEEAAALLEADGALPPPFVDEATTPALIDAENPPDDQFVGNPTGEVFGAADQYRSANTGGTGGFFDPNDLARADEALAQEQADARESKRIDDYNKNPFIGFPDIDDGESYYRVTDENDINAYGRGIGRDGPDVYGGTSREEIQRVGRERGGPVYRADDIQDTIANWSATQIIEFQDKAIEAGLIDSSTRIDGVFYTPGILDQHTLRALTSAMLTANLHGDKQTYDEALDVMIVGRQAYFDKYGDPNAPPTFTPSRAYFAPDYTEISERVKAQFAQKLGRTPNGWEMDLLADEFKSDHRAAYNADIAGEKAVFDAKGRAAETGETSAPGTFSDINPATRMSDTFDEQFGDEIDAKTRWSDVQSKSRNLFGSFDTLSKA